MLGPAMVLDRAKGALYGMLIADALSMPSHWFYGGQAQIVREYGGAIAGYIAPNTHLAGSIMGKSNTGGAGRGGSSSKLIGDVIFHGKNKYWQPGSDYHYHQGMAAGDNTLEALLSRRVMNVTTAAGGSFDAKALVEDYIAFMTTPGTHNDTYCGTCHRMFFANLVEGTPVENCPSNDGHNVDTADALVTTIPVALLAGSDEEAASDVQKMVSSTRNSPKSNSYAALFASLLRGVVKGRRPVRDAVSEVASSLRYDLRAASSSARDPVTA